MKFAAVRPFAEPEAAARKLIELANAVEAVQDGRIYIELLNGPMLFEHKATPAEYSAGLAIKHRWLKMRESGTATSPHLPHCGTHQLAAIDHLAARLVPSGERASQPL